MKYELQSCVGVRVLKITRFPCMVQKNEVPIQTCDVSGIPSKEYP